MIKNKSHIAICMQKLSLSMLKAAKCLKSSVFGLRKKLSSFWLVCISKLQQELTDDLDHDLLILK